MRKTALVTGASRGIGAAIAEELAAHGYAVAIHYHRSRELAEAVARKLKTQYQVDALPVQADVAVPEQVLAAVETVVREFGPIDVLVNNAGIASQKLLTDVSAQEWQRMLAVHVNGAYHTCRCVLPEMLRRHAGCIVNISSIWGIVGASCEVPYSTAKAALIGMTKALAKEVGPSGIRVNCVAPGVIETDMMSGFSAEDKAALAQETPLERLGTAQDVAKTVAFLASEDAGFITGQVISPNGGFVI